MTSQLFANIYLDAFDHFIKEKLRVKYYLRYTDDAVFLYHDKEYFIGYLAIIQAWLWENRRLNLHPQKIEICKLTQGIDFLGYVTLPRYRVLRTKTKRRMMRRINANNRASYLGLVRYCRAFEIRKQIIAKPLDLT